MTQQEIKDQINQEFVSFQGQPFGGIVPEWFLEKFEAAVMEVPQSLVPYRGDQIQSIISKKKVGDLSFVDVGLMAEIFLVVAPKFVDKKVAGFVVRKIQLENIRLQFNELQDRELKRLQKKAASLNMLTNPNRMAKA